MDPLLEMLRGPWPWYVAGPLIGLMVPLMLFIGNRSFGISNNLRHLCAITQPKQVEVDFFKYNWKEHTWSLVFVIGTALGGLLAGVVLGGIISAMLFRAIAASAPTLTSLIILHPEPCLSLLFFSVSFNI